MMDQQLIYCITVMSPALNTNVDKPQKKKHIGLGGGQINSGCWGLLSSTTSHDNWPLLLLLLLLFVECFVVAKAKAQARSTARAIKKTLICRLLWPRN